MTWHNVTVEQYQKLAKVLTDKTIEVDDKQMNVVSILFDLTLKQIYELPLEEYTKKAKQVQFIFTEEIPGRPQKYIKANGKTYLVNYRVEKQRFGQYIESITYGANYIENLHLLMASVVHPVKKILWFKRVQKNDSANHEAISTDMLQAKFVDVYHTAVFFYRVLRGSMKITRNSLVLDLVKKGVKEREAKLMIAASINAMDGFITPHKLPFTNVLV